MSENPYQPPQQSTSAVGVLSGSRGDLRKVAWFQKGVLICILIQLVAIFGQFFIPPEIGLIISLAMLITGVAGSVFACLLAINLYGTGTGILLGVLCLIPCIGLICLLVVNGKATAVLKQNGVKVGLLGAKLSEV